MKKIFIWIIIAVMVALVVSIFFNVKRNDEKTYTLEETIDLLNKGTYIKGSNYSEKTVVYSVDPALRKTKLYEQAKYLKDNYFYMISTYGAESQEYYYNKESNVSYQIDNVNKTIDCVRNDIYNIEKFGDYDEFNMYLTTYKDSGQSNPFKFHSSVNLDGVDCIKVSLSCKFEDRYQREYFYIDKETGWILNIEEWLGTSESTLVKTKEMVYTRSYDTVEDSMVPKFNISEYSGYVYYDVDLSKVNSVFDYSFDKISISVKEDTISNSSVDVIFNTNGIDEEDTVVRTYRLLKKEEGEYKEMENANVLISQDMALPLTPEMHIDFTEKYGSLEAGEYDLVITIEKKGESNIKADLVTPFMVK